MKRPYSHRRARHRQVGVSTETTTVEVGTPDDAPETALIPAPDDPTFLPPSKHVAALLRMLADSRVLSLGELNELAFFIDERRARLRNELTACKGSI